MSSLKLTQVFSGDEAWKKFVFFASKSWSNFLFKDALLHEVGGDLELAKVVAYRMGDGFKAGLDYPTPALEGKTPRWCIENTGDLNGLKELLLRMP